MMSRILLTIVALTYVGIGILALVYTTDRFFTATALLVGFMAGMGLKALEAAE